MLTFRPAHISDCLFIARGFHMAMLYEDVSESQLHIFSNHVCVREDVLYSWRNTLVALWDGEPVGMLTAYDGRHYSEMRRITMQLVKKHLGVEFPGMEDEARAGEYYLDSLAVLPEWRGRGIGKALLQEGIRTGHSLGLTVTLAVDPVNERAQRLYRSLGFLSAGELFIFGHTYWKMSKTLASQ